MAICDWKIYCLDAANGAHIWNYTTSGQAIVSSPAVADEKVYVGSDDGKIYCLDAANGAHIWNYTTNNKIQSSPAVADSVVFVGSDDYFLYAFGTIIRVPEDYLTIQQAIDAAGSGDTVMVAPGTYDEDLIVNKPITLLGGKGSSPVFDGGGSGIAVTLLPEASGSTVAGITITNYDQAILILDSSNSEIYNNTFSIMTQSGITLEGLNAVGNRIYSNIFDDSNVAVNLTASAEDNMIFENVISLNSIGLNLESNGNTVYANTFSENQVGINLASSSDNVIYSNNFVGNEVQFVNEASSNIWDNGYPAGGNYWSNHISTDICSGPSQNEDGSDGILDEPYVIDGSNVDNYPLATPYAPPQNNIVVRSLVLTKKVVCQGYPVSIKVVIENQAEISRLVNMMAFADSQFIRNVEVTINSVTVKTSTFEWNTAGYTKGNYTVSVRADPIAGEISTEDNGLTDGWILVSMVGDITGPDGWPDGVCDIRDVAGVAKLFGVDYPDPRFNANYDINSDLKIDIKDIAVVASHFGEIDP